jgi:hypothetical protein
LIGLGLQLSAEALHRLSRLCCQPKDEGIHFLAHFGGGAKAGVGRNFFPNPISDDLIRDEIGAVTHQSDQAQLEVRGGKVGAHRRPPMAGPLSQITISGPLYFSRNRVRNATEVSAFVLPSTGIASTAPVSRQTAE